MKKFGIEMGAPYFKQRNLIKKKEICIRSSNYALYGDMSRRVMETLRHLTDKVEPYSIDEAFIELPKMLKKDLTSFGHKVKSTVRQWTGLPVSVGIAPSKTLAKIANETAKGHPDYQNVLNLADNPKLNTILEQTKLSDVWGIGSGLSQRLHKEGITNALQLKHQIEHREWVRKRLHVTGLRTVMELNGESCMEIEHANEPRKGIMTFRSFREPVTDIKDLKEAVAQYISIAAEKLRAQHSVASLLHVTLRTNKYSQYKSKYKYGIEYPLPAPTASTAYLIKCGHACLERLYDKELRYKKAAIMLTGIIPQSEVQTDLFNDQQFSTKEYQLMQKVDEINTRYGSDTAHFAATGFHQTWNMKQEHLSSKYTTNWDELMEAQSL